jgi:iron complex transport system substrate-binding protein
VGKSLSQNCRIVLKRCASEEQQFRIARDVFLIEWVDPVSCSGHWQPELVEIAGGYDPLGRKHQPSVEIKWEAVLEAQPDIIVLALCGYDADLAATRLRIT